jgi:3-deoxy-D-manno-octulosonic-acid transferase
MYGLFLTVYNIVAVPLQYLAFITGALFSSKIRKGLAGRIGTLAGLRRYMLSVSNTKKVVLIHSASTGEWEQSVQIIRQLKSRRSDLVFVASFFSPSGYQHADTKDAGYKFYLPFDDPFHARMLMEIARPSCIIISKYDLWPNMINAAAWKSIPMVLASAELAGDSYRHIGLIGQANKLFYSKLTKILPVSHEYAGRFSEIIDDSSKITVTGDARFDQIKCKADTYRQEGKALIFAKDNPTIICGSTWPADEDCILPALFSLKRQGLKINIAIVPHEIGKKRLAALKQKMVNASMRSISLSELKRGQLVQDQILIVDTIGQLASLYQIGSMAYIGGGFGRGVHNVAEAAAFALPVLVGPKHINSFEAGMLIDIGAAECVHNLHEAEKKIRLWAEKPYIAQEAGRKAIDFFESKLGGAEKTCSIIDELLAK